LETYAAIDRKRERDEILKAQAAQKLEADARKREIDKRLKAEVVQKPEDGNKSEHYEKMDLDEEEVLTKEQEAALAKALPPLSVGPGEHFIRDAVLSSTQRH
jgi:hypothetical protein